MHRQVIMTLHADRHASDDRAFATTYFTDVRNGTLTEVLLAVAGEVDDEVWDDYARVTVTIGEPHE